MKALLRGERTVGPVVMGVLVALFLMAVTMLILASGYRNQFFHLKHVIYQRCQAREAYDEASQESREALRWWFIRHQAEETSNPFIDAKLRKARTSDDAVVIAKLQHTLTVGAPRGCSAYK